MNAFRALYRLFLFRLMDVELLSASARGDSNVLLGQFATILIFGSILSSGSALAIGQEVRDHFAPESLWPVERFLVSISMLVVGIFALLSWDSIFIDRRDVFMLFPMPLRIRTLFLAKAAASASALGLALAAWNCLSGFAWPLVMTPSSLGITGSLRFIAAYWLTMLAAGAFVYCAILSVQALLAQFPRRWCLRVSPLLQAATFVLFLAIVFLQPSLNTPAALGAPENQRALVWLPTYWFSGLLSELSGVLATEGHGVTAPLAHRAVQNGFIVLLAAALGFYMSYRRTLRLIVEEPDSLPKTRGSFPLPPFGTPPQTAVAQFIVRTLYRSQRHRVILAFYLGGGFAVAAIYLGGAVQAMNMTWLDFVRRVNFPILVATVVMLCASWLGTRSVFSLPLDLRANWIFQLTPATAGLRCLAAVRRALLFAWLLPVLAISALLLCLWPSTVLSENLLILALLGVILADISLHGFEKIPFTCSYLPGKSKVHLIFWCTITPFVAAVHKATEFELQALRTPRTYWLIVSSLLVVGILARCITNRAAHGIEPQVQFEDTASDQLVGLGLHG